jgi:hypothetical protein
LILIKIKLIFWQRCPEVAQIERGSKIFFFFSKIIAQKNKIFDYWGFAPPLLGTPLFFEQKSLSVLLLFWFIT